jgi:RNA polymerase sigma factor (sigma-70 family)
MQELDDNALLREYVNHDSEEAFATLVTRHVNKVYSVALRHTRNPHQAEEITQAVFVILAKKSHYLGKGVVLSGWLYQTSRLTAVTFIRSEIRRARREQEAYMQTIFNENESDVWPQIAPLLDAAMAGLSEADRHAIVLRFFDGKSMKEVGIALGASEDAAKMRLNRAVEKLRRFFTKRGIVLPAAILTAAISANSVQAAPVALAKSVTAVAIVKGSIAAASTLTLVKGTMKMMTWLKLKFAICLGAAALFVGGVATVAISGDSTGNDTKAVEQQTSELIVPGTSVGKVKAGMSTDDLLPLFGKPDRKPERILGKDGEVWVWDYTRYGFTVFSSVYGVAAVMCGDASGTNDLLVKAFKALTEEGIGMGSTRAEVVQAFGQPTAAKPWNAGQEQLEYKPLGLTLTLKAGKVIHIIVDFPAITAGTVSSIWYIQNYNPEKIISNLRRVTNAKKDESNQHALMRYFKLKGIEFTSPPRVFFDEQNGLVKIRTSKDQADRITVAMGILMSGNPDTAK